MFWSGRKQALDVMREWDIKIMPVKISDKLKEHGIEKAYDIDSPIPSDEGLLDDFRNASISRH